MTPTLVSPAGTLTPAQVEDRVRRTMSVLRAAGLREGGVLALMLPNGPVLIELMLAAKWLGAYWCPINTHYKAEEVGHILRDSGAALLVVQARWWPVVAPGVPAGLPVYLAGGDALRAGVPGNGEAARAEPVWGEAVPSDAALGDAAPGAAYPAWEALRDAARPAAEAPAVARSPMLYTSGTTGRPKGIRRQPATPEQAAHGAARLREVIGAGPGMRALLSAPLYHSAPNSFAMATAQHNGLLVIEERFDAETTLRLIEAHAITHAYLVPTMYQRLLRLPEAVRQRYDLRSLRFVSSTGSPCPPAVKRAMIEWWGPVIHEAYGSSELGYMTHLTSEQALRKPGSAGLPLHGVHLRILDEAGQPCAAGVPGLIHVRTEHWADFSYNHGDEARRAMERDGHLTMGDIGCLDEDGFLFIVDRAADMVISGGVNIYPAEVEAVLHGLPGVADCAAFGIPDAEFGEALAVAVQALPGAVLTADTVQAWLRERLAGYKVPRVVAFHETLPREDSGKIFKRRLREPYWAGQARRI